MDTFTPDQYVSIQINAPSDEMKWGIFIRSDQVKPLIEKVRKAVEETRGTAGYGS